MTPYILISVERPTGDSILADGSWSSFLQATQSIKAEDKSVFPLNEGTWLLLERDGVSNLARIVSAAERNRLKYRTWFLKE